MFDVAASSALVLLLLRAVRTGAAGDWLLLGAVAAVAFNIKLLPALVLASCAAPRAALSRPWPWAAAAVAAAGAAGTGWWQHANGWPQLSLASSVATGGSGTSVDRSLLVPMLPTVTGPAAADALVMGAVALWRQAEHRWVAVAAALHLLLTLTAGGKPYYLLPWVPVLVAAAVPALPRWAAQRRDRRRLLVSLVVANVVTSVLIALPVLPPRWAPVALVHDHGEQVGWQELVAAVAAADVDDPVDVVLTANYGQAGALDVARRSGVPLPAVYSGHNAYAWWGPPPERAEHVLVVGRWSDETLADWFTGCHAVAEVHNRAGVENDEQGVPVGRCHGPRAPGGTSGRSCVGSDDSNVGESRPHPSSRRTPSRSIGCTWSASVSITTARR